MMRQQDWMRVLLGTWVLFSPWVLRLSGAHGEATWDTSLLGAALVALAGPAVLVPKAWEKPTTILLGGVLLVSPWVLDVGGQTGPTSSAVIVAALVVALVAEVARDAAVVGRRRRQPKTS